MVTRLQLRVRLGDWHVARSISQAHDREIFQPSASESTLALRRKRPIWRAQNDQISRSISNWLRLYEGVGIRLSGILVD